MALITNITSLVFTQSFFLELCENFRTQNKILFCVKLQSDYDIDDPKHYHRSVKNSPFWKDIYWNHTPIQQLVKDLKAFFHAAAKECISFTKKLESVEPLFGATQLFGQFLWFSLDQSCSIHFSGHLAFFDALHSW